MKKIVIFILLIVLCSCTRSNTNTVVNLPVNPIDENSSVNEVAIESLNTMEFIAYWKLFRKAILEKDTITLSTMINDSIDGGWFLLRDHSENVGKISKSFFMDSLYVLFTPEFLSLLKSYEIEKYLGSNRENILWKKAEKKTYKSYVKFGYYQIDERKIDLYNVAFYKMSWRRNKEDYKENYVMLRKDETEGLDFLTVKQIFIERDFERLDHLIFELKFVKSSGEIKLDSVDLSYILDISD